MHPHRYGLGPRMGSPEAAARDRTADAPLVDSGAWPAADLTPQKEPAPAAQATQSREQNEHADCASADAPGRSFSTLLAELTRIGYGLQLAPWGGYLITRWNRSREEASLDGVERFLRKVAP